MGLGVHERAYCFPAEGSAALRRLLGCDLHQAGAERGFLGAKTYTIWGHILRKIYKTKDTKLNMK